MAPRNSGPSQKQLDYILRLANELTGERARYYSHSSVLPRKVDTSVEASGLVDDLKAAIEAEKERQETTGLVIGARLCHHYVTRKGVKIIAEGEITGYEWSGMKVAGLVYDATPETRKAAGFSESGKTVIDLTRLGSPAAEDAGELKAERERLLARIAEIDALMAARNSPEEH